MASTTSITTITSKPFLANEKTLGEELFLVHLSRFQKNEPSPEDFDRYQEYYPDNNTGKKSQKESLPRYRFPLENTSRRMSVGEELWRIHCKRNQGAAATATATPITSSDEEDCDEVETARTSPVRKHTAAAAAVKANTTLPKRKQQKQLLKKKKIMPKRGRLLHLRNRDVKVHV